MDEKFNSVLSIALIPQTVALIAENQGLDDITALNEFYQSKVYKLLSKKERAWHYKVKPLFIAFVQIRRRNLLNSNKKNNIRKSWKSVKRAFRLLLCIMITVSLIVAYKILPCCTFVAHGKVQ